MANAILTHTIALWVVTSERSVIRGERGVSNSGEHKVSQGIMVGRLTIWQEGPLSPWAGDEYVERVIMRQE